MLILIGQQSRDRKSIKPVNILWQTETGHSPLPSDSAKVKITNLRTPQMTQPVFDPNGVSVHFTLCCRKCTHFAWPIYTYIEAFGSKTLLGLVVQLYSHNIIQSVYYTCTAFCCY